MNRKYTKAQARALFGAANDYQLSKALDTSHQRLIRVGDDEDLSLAFQWQIRAMIAEGKVPNAKPGSDEQRPA